MPPRDPGGLADRLAATPARSALGTAKGPGGTSIKNGSLRHLRGPFPFANVQYFWGCAGSADERRRFSPVAAISMPWPAGYGRLGPQTSGRRRPQVWNLLAPCKEVRRPHISGCALGQNPIGRWPLRAKSGHSQTTWQQAGLDPLLPFKIHLSNGRNDEKADFDAGRGCAKGGRFLSDEFGLS